MPSSSLTGTITVSSYDLIDVFDTPVLDTSVSNITASSAAPLSVVASLAANCKKIQCIDTTGEFIGIYSDPSGTPVLLGVIGPGSDQLIDIEIAIATEIGVRNMADAVISIGKLSINFMG